MKPIYLLSAYALFLIGWSHAQTVDSASVLQRVPVVFSGGHQTDLRDGGRPIVLIAAALEVKPEVFRLAFSHVHPANPEIGPTREEADRNKRALLEVLGPYGVTNNRLDTVSNYYRYVPERHELWKHQAAEAVALVHNGQVTGFEIVQGGAGYSSPPTVTVPQFASTKIQAEVAFGKELATNGRISVLRLEPVVTSTENH